MEKNKRPYKYPCVKCGSPNNKNMVLTAGSTCRKCKNHGRTMCDNCHKRRTNKRVNVPSFCHVCIKDRIVTKEPWINDFIPLPNRWLSCPPVPEKIHERESFVHVDPEFKPPPVPRAWQIGRGKNKQF